MQHLSPSHTEPTCRTMLIAACLAGLAACAPSLDDAGTATPASGASLESIQASTAASTGSATIAFHPAPAMRAASTPIATALGSGNVTYHGGPVISNVRVTVVYWTSAVAFQSTWPSYYPGVTNSTYLDWLTEYHTSTQGIGRGSFVKAVVDPSPPSGTTITQSQIEAEIKRLIQVGTIATPGANDLTMVYFPPGYTVLAGGWFSCTPTDGFCGFHSATLNNGVEDYYGVIVDSSACGSRCGPGTQLANTESVSSHELVEAISDPLLNAWFDSSDGSEIADICQDMQAQVSGFTVQKAWSQLQDACVVRNPCLACASGTSCHCGDFVCRQNNTQCP